MRNRFLISVLILSIFSSFAFSQKSIIIGEEHVLHSNILNEEREYWIHFPESYSKADDEVEGYPVIYLLDGENNFHSLVGIQKSLTKGMYNSMPECIIVGVVNVDRVRDFTPSKSFVERNGERSMTHSGGAESFLLFLTKELRKELSSKYRTNDYNILIGHSLGGLFAINTLLHDSDTFDAYISLDPSLWWDDRKVFKEAKNLWIEKGFAYKNLFIGMAKMSERAGDKQQHSETINEFCTTLFPYSPINKLQADWKYYGDESHGTVTTIGMLDGLRTLFKGIELPVKQVPKNPDLISEHYDKLSRRLGHKFTPSKILIERLSKYAESVVEHGNANKILEYNE